MRVGVAIGDLLVRRGILDVLGSSQAVTVAGEAADLEQGRALLREGHVEVMLVGTRLPPLLEAGAPLLLQEARAHRVATLVIADAIDPTTAALLMSDGAQGWGWLARASVTQPAQLIGALERVHRGGTVVDDAIVHDLATRRPPAPQPPG